MMKATQKFAVSGQTVHPFVQQEGTVVEKVPAGLYEIKESIFGYYLLKKAETVELPTTIYGSTLSRTNRILNTFDNQTAAMAVGLFGVKGTGKTLLANVLTNMTIQRNQTVIDVSSTFCTEPSYLEFINSLGSITIIFDEFLKHLSKQASENESNNSNDSRTVARNRQDEMLTFFQGTNNSKRLIILIDNNPYMLSDFLQDRPGRMRYWFDYVGVESDVVTALCDDAGLDEKKTESLIVYARRYRVTFDIISCIISEWVLYPEETLEHLTKIMNVPELREEYTTKATVKEYKLPTGLVLENELVQVKSNGEFHLAVSRPNQFYNEPELSEEDFKKSKWHEDYSYEYYRDLRTEPRLFDAIGITDSHLCGVSGNKQAYKVGDSLTVTIELFDTFRSHGTELNSFF